MQLRINTLMAGPQGVYRPGSVVDVPNAVAERLIDRGAERLERAAVVETSAMNHRSGELRRKKRGR